MTLNWLGVDLLTGQVLADLVDIELTSTLTRTLGQYDSASVVLHVGDATPPQWLRAVMAGASALCAYSGAPGAEVVVWGGIVRQVVRDLGPEVSLALDTAEAYLDGCFCDGYASTTGETWDEIVADLLGYASGAGRMPFALASSGTAASGAGSYSAALGSNTSVYAALQQLEAQGVIEFTVEWVWKHGSTDLITPTLVEGARVGVDPDTGLQPAATFETENLIAGTVAQDYSTGHGANVVTVYGQPASSSGTAPTATAQAVNTQGRPLWEYRYSPQQTATTIAALTAYAAQALAELESGSQPVTLQAALDQPGLVLGTDWHIGDTIGYVIDGPAFPEPVTGSGRCIGYELDLVSVTPVLQGQTLP